MACWVSTPSGQKEPWSPSVCPLGMGPHGESLGSGFTPMPPILQKSPSSASSGSRVPSWKPLPETHW